MKNKLIHRTGKPNKNDQLPFGTICKSFSTEDSYDIYKQVSKDENKPVWEFITNIDNSIAINADELQ